MSDPDVKVSRTIGAPAHELWEKVSDVTRMGEWSPETTSCKWIKGATGPAVGAKFKGDNRIGRRKWSTGAEVVECEPGKSFVFDVSVGPITYARWGYHFEPSGDGTVVTETWKLTTTPLFLKLGRMVSGVADRREHNRLSMEKTLEALAASV